MLSQETEQAVLDRQAEVVQTTNEIARPSQHNLLRWLNRGSLAILDQGLISGSNFLMSILLARWLTPGLYGAYAVAFGILVLLTLIYSALVLEPMSVFGGAAYRDCLLGYVKSLLRIHVAVSTAFALFVSTGAFLVYHSGRDAGLAGALLGIALASPCVLLLWVLRRALYLKMHSGCAATGSLLYCFLMIAGLWALNARLLLSPFTAIVLMGAAALVAGALLMAFLVADFGRARVAGPDFAEAWQRHWQYGRWALGSNFAAWIPAYIFLPLLTAFAGMARSGELKALTNFVAPLDQTLAALALLLLPHAARVRAEHGSQDMRTLTRNLLALSIAGSAIYWLIVVNLRGSVFSLLYSGKYFDVANLLPAVALGSILWSAAYGPAIALRAMESPKSVFAAYLVTTLVCLLVGVPATRYFGLKGAIWSGNAADLASLIVILFVVYRKLSDREKVASSLLCAVPLPGDLKV